MSTFERYLTLWVALCIVVGVGLGHVMPGVFQAIGAAEVTKVNLPVAVLIWLMVIPMLLKIEFAALGLVTRPSLIAQALAPSAIAFLLAQVSTQAAIGVLAALTLANIALVSGLWTAHPLHKS